MTPPDLRDPVVSRRVHDAAGLLVDHSSTLTETRAEGITALVSAAAALAHIEGMSAEALVALVQGYHETFGVVTALTSTGET